MMGTLIIARHHESQWNREGRWTGTRDVPLTPEGLAHSSAMGLLLAGERIDAAFASIQVRAIETLAAMLEALSINIESIPVTYNKALDERDYGEYTGKNKWEMEELLGKAQWEEVRRAWDCPVPGGETLKMVYERVVPYYTSHILPLLAAGNNVLVVSHGNALRALTMYLESIPPEHAKDVEMLFGAVVLYSLTDEGRMRSKEVRSVASEVHA